MAVDPPVAAGVSPVVFRCSRRHENVFGPTVEAGVRVKVTIQSPGGHCIEHVADVQGEGDLLKAVGAAMEDYRKVHHDIPLFDHSSIKIERR